MQGVTKLEAAVIEKLLDGDHPTLNVLREQWKGCRVRSRDHTGVGFYTFFEVGTGTPKVGTAGFELADVSADIPALRNGAGFVLFVRNGSIDNLEGFSYDEALPTDIPDFSLRYNRSPRLLDLPLPSSYP